MIAGPNSALGGGIIGPVKKAPSKRLCEALRGSLIAGQASLAAGRRNHQAQDAARVSTIRASRVEPSGSIESSKVKPALWSIAVPSCPMVK